MLVPSLPSLPPARLVSCLALVLGALVQLSGCESAPAAGTDESSAEKVEFRIDTEVRGLELRLSEDQPQAPEDGGVTRADPKKLSKKQLDTLLSRLPPMEEESLGRDFALREASQPPPITGQTLAQEFPPKDQGEAAPKVETGPLSVLRRAPEGAVEIAPHLSVTFSQPMVAVSTQEQASRVRPVLLAPEPPGEWRWLGTRTLLFDPKPRLPMATEYTVEIPKGTRSALGESLAEAVRWTFSTPPVQVRNAWPQYGPHKLDPLIFLSFDQQVSAPAILPFVELSTGGTAVPLRPATDSEIEADRGISTMKADLVEGRWLALVAQSPLRPGTSYQLSLRRGAPSAEGPRLSESSWSQQFYTYHPLQIVDQDCSSGLSGCSPQGALWVHFNNGIDPELFDAESVRVSPSVEQFSAQASGGSITLHGKWKPMTSYEITFPASLKDQFGQRLGRDQGRNFKIGHAPRSIEGPGRDFLVLDPTAPPAWSVYTINHKSVKVKIWEEKAEDFAGVSEWMRKAVYDGDVRGTPPGRLLVNRTMAVEGYVADELVETTIDLAPYLQGGKGHLFVWVEPTIQPRERWDRVRLFGWVQATDIGLTALIDGRKISGWATNLADGRPIEGAELQLLGQDERARTGQDGLASLAPYPGHKGPQALIARVGQDVALLPEQSGWWNESGSWLKSDDRPSLLWYVFDDRRMYRPGEEVKIKGWIRRLDGSPGGDLMGFDKAAGKTSWRLTDSLGNEIGKGETPIDESGGFDLALTLPKTPNLGWANLSLNADGCAILQCHHSHEFQIQEFRRPEFEVSTNLDPRPYVLGERAHASVAATYYAGGALPGADVTWTATWSPASFTPPNQADFQFGGWSPWWSFMDPDDAPAENGSVSLSGKTDPTGTHRVKVDFLALNPPRPMSVRLEAAVTDVNRQRWTSGESLVLHPSSRYVGIRPKHWFHEADQPVEVDVIVVDVEGSVQSGVPVEVGMSRLEWKYKNGRWGQVRSEPSNCSLVSRADPAPCSFETSQGGLFEVVALVKDSLGRPSESVVQLYVSGGGSAIPNRDVAMEELTLVPNQKSWQPGDTAEIFVQAPFFPAEGLYSLNRNGVVERVRFSMEGPSTTLKIPITERHIPNLTLEVDLVGSAVRVDDKGVPMPGKSRRPAYAHGSLALSVPPLSRTLKVEVRPREAAIQPGESTTIDVEVKDAAGRPIQAELVIVAADESVLALSGYKLPDPLEFFYASRPAGVQEAHLRGSITLARPDEVAAAAPGTGGFGRLGTLGGEGYGSGGVGLRGAMPQGSTGVMADVTTLAAPTTARSPNKKSLERRSASGRDKMMMVPTEESEAKEDDSRLEEGPAIELRTDFNALALFAPRVQTDAQGKASVPLKLPDSLTRYRIMAVAVSGEKTFGSGESTLTARKPIMLRPSAPRFLNFGDRMELPLVVQNQTNAPIEVQLGLRVANARVIDSLREKEDPTRALDQERTAGLRLLIPANDRREVRIPVAAVLAGKARFQAVIASGRFTDAALFDLPVWTPSTTEAFATYGEIDQGATLQPIDAPENVWPQFGGLEVTTSSTALSALTDAVLYLQSYPFDCTEQIASKILAVAALRDVLSAFEAQGLPEPKELEESVQAELSRIDRRQHWNGGFSYWPGLPDNPYVTIHTTHALVRAKKKGFDVPQNVISRADGYLRNIESHIPGWYPPEVRWSLVAYSVSVRHLNGDNDLGRARRLMSEAGIARLPLEAQAWILPVLVEGKATQEAEAILRNFENRATETAATAQFDTAYGDQADYLLLHSDRRTDAIILDALMEVRPKHDLVVKVVRGLLGHARAGRWSTTQENTFVLLAMDRYFRTYEATTPDFVARVWLGQAYAGEHAFKGRTTERARIDVPMHWLVDPGGRQNLAIAKEGAGRLYYRVGMRYAPLDLVSKPADYGFAVERRYEPIDDPKDVMKQEDGSWRIRAGARVRVRVTMVAPARRYHVALVDPLPAGLEAMNPVLAVTGTIPQDPNASTGRYWWWQSAWYEHQNLRDERVEAFASLLWDGVHEYSYVANATTPGRFVVPPPKAEEMYHPETFGRGATDIVWVE